MDKLVQKKIFFLLFFPCYFTIKNIMRRLILILKKPTRYQTQQKEQLQYVDIKNDHFKLLDFTVTVLKQSTIHFYLIYTSF